MEDRMKLIQGMSESSGDAVPVEERKINLNLNDKKLGKQSEQQNIFTARTKKEALEKTEHEKKVLIINLKKSKDNGYKSKITGRAKGNAKVFPG